MRHTTAEEVYLSYTRLPPNERARFFALLANPAALSSNFSHEQVFGHLSGARFTAQEAAEYLGVSIATFRRYVAHGKLTAIAEVGRNQLFATEDLKRFKRAQQEVRRQVVVTDA